MRTSNVLRRVSHVALAGLLSAAPVLAGSLLIPAVAMAQSQALRTVGGKVVTKEGAPVKGAVVYLKDDHTLAVKSYIAGDDGSYHFGQLSPTTDYTLWAESNGKKTGNKSISSFDSRNQFDYTLQLK